MLAVQPAYRGAIASQGGVAPAFSNTKSFLLDGVDEFVDFGNVHNATAGFSVFVWVKSTWTAGSDAIISKYNTTGNQRSWWLAVTDSGDIRATISPNGSYSGVAKDYQTNVAWLGDNEWHLVGFVFSSDDLDISIDGIELTTSDYTLTADNVVTTIHSGTASMEIGRNAGSSNYFAGNIDDAYIFDKRLTALEQMELYYGGTQLDLVDFSAYGNALGWWRMGDDPLDDATGGTGNVQDQISTNHGTPTNTEVGDCVVDTLAWANTLSLSLDGIDERVDCGNAVPFQTGGPFSASLWIKAPGAVGSFATVFAKSDGVTDGWTVQLRNTDSEWRFWINFGVNALGDGSNGGWYYASLAETWSDNLWHHVVVVWDGVAPMIYVDDVAGTNAQPPSGEGSLPNISPETTNPLMIGAESDGGNHTAAIVDEVQFYSSALSASAVSEIFNSGAPQNEVRRTDAVSQWRAGDHPADDATGGTGLIVDVVGLSHGSPINTEGGDIVVDAP